MSTPRTNEAFDAYSRGACGTVTLCHKMAEMERELTEARKDAADLALAIAEHQECMNADDTSVFSWENIKTKEAALYTALAAHNTLTTKGNEA